MSSMASWNRAPSLAIATPAAGQDAEPERPARPRTSEILRGILSKNPDVKSFSVQRILASIGGDCFEASLMMFSLPAMLPLPGAWGSAGVSARAIGGQLLSGETQIRLPRAILRKSVSRKALAVAIHAIVPILEAAEQVVRPRWQWVNHSNTRRAIGLFVFVLAAAIAFPLFGFSPLHATSIFVMAFGMAEQDGLAVLVGVAVGVLSLALLAASGLSARALRARAGKWLRQLSKKLGFSAFNKYLKRRGYRKLANVLSLRWSDLLLLWDPEKSEAARKAGLSRLKRAGRGSAPYAPRAA